MKYSCKGYKDTNRYKNRLKWSGQVQLVYVKDINHNIPPREGEPVGTVWWQCCNQKAAAYK